MYGKIEETSNKETPTGEQGVIEGDRSESSGDAGSKPGAPEAGPEAEGRATTSEPESLTALRFVGPATAQVLTEADVSAGELRERRVSYRELVDIGVNAGVAARIRREYSLSWTFDSSDGDLGRRSAQVRGLDEAERAWVAASSGDWENAARERDEEGAGEETAGGSTACGSTTGGSSADGSAVGDWNPTGRAAQSDRSSTGRTVDGDWTPGGVASAEADGGGDPRAAESAWRRRSAPEPVIELEPIDEEIAAELAEAGVTSIRRLSTIDPEHVADALLLDAERVREWHEAAREYRA